MARLLTIDRDREEINNLLLRLFQSGNINFLIGSGASMPAIRIAGQIEKEINALKESNKEAEAESKIATFLSEMLPVNNALINDAALCKFNGEKEEEYQTRQSSFEQTKRNYHGFLSSIEFILSQRKTNLLPRQANIFTTNYDLFIEAASNKFSSFKLNDGFLRTPSLTNRFIFSPQSFFTSISNTGNLYNYKVEIPSINLIKVHGSLSWKHSDNEVVFETKVQQPLPTTASADQVETFNNQFSIVLPQNAKFKQTLLDRWYYDLLRIYSNELDKEGTLLLVFGFSFGDEHLLDITKRALKNPTLLIVISAYSSEAADAFQKQFADHSNVLILARSEESLDLQTFNQVLRDALKWKKELADERT